MSDLLPGSNPSIQPWQATVMARIVDGHPASCPCVVCNPSWCAACGITTTHLRDGACTHRRACEARQMLNSGASAAEAARHAQGSTPDLCSARQHDPEGVSKPHWCTLPAGHEGDHDPRPACEICGERSDMWAGGVWICDTCEDEHRAEAP